MQVASSAQNLLGAFLTVVLWSAGPCVPQKGCGLNHRSLIHAGLITAVGLACISLRAQQANQPPQYVEKSYPVPAGNQLPDTNAQMKMHQKQALKKNFDAANMERKRQIESDTAELVELARELKAAVQNRRQDKSPTDAIRKAELIERLAHDVREKMKLTATGS